VLECLPVRIGEIITQSLAIPTIGIGSGPYCDGQALVTPNLATQPGPTKISPVCRMQPMAAAKNVMMRNLKKISPDASSAIPQKI